MRADTPNTIICDPAVKVMILGMGVGMSRVYQKVLCTDFLSFMGIFKTELLSGSLLIAYLTTVPTKVHFRENLSVDYLSKPVLS